MAQHTETESLAPVLVDLGTIKGKTVRRFKEGRGRLAGEIQDVLTDVRQRLGPEAATKELVPVVLLYRKKRKGKCKTGGGLFF
jgi:hypothetical protein